MGSWRSGTQQPAVLRSACYQFPANRSEGDQFNSLLVVAAAGRIDPREAVVQWANEDGEPAGGIGFADLGSAPAWRNLRAPMAAIPRDATQVRLVTTDDDLNPQHWIAITPPGITQRRTLQDVAGSQDPVLLDWLVGPAFPCQCPFDHQNGVIKEPKWRILPRPVQRRSPLARSWTTSAAGRSASPNSSPGAVSRSVNQALRGAVCIELIWPLQRPIDQPDGVRKRLARHRLGDYYAGTQMHATG